MCVAGFIIKINTQRGITWKTVQPYSFYFQRHIGTCFVLAVLLKSSLTVQLSREQFSLNLSILSTTSPFSVFYMVGCYFFWSEASFMHREKWLHSWRLSHCFKLLLKSMAIFARLNLAKIRDTTKGLAVRSMNFKFYGEWNYRIKYLTYFQNVSVKLEAWF